MPDEIAHDLVKEIAEQSPIIPTYHEINECKFCQTSWAEDSYEEYLNNELLLNHDPNAKRRYGIPVPLRMEHHDTDCLWVRANGIVARTKSFGSNSEQTGT